MKTLTVEGWRSLRNRWRCNRITLWIARPRGEGRAKTDQRGPDFGAVMLIGLLPPRRTVP